MGQSHWKDSRSINQTWQLNQYFEVLWIWRLKRLFFHKQASQQIPLFPLSATLWFKQEGKNGNSRLTLLVALFRLFCFLDLQSREEKAGKLGRVGKRELVCWLEATIIGMWAATRASVSLYLALNKILDWSPFLTFSCFVRESWPGTPQSPTLGIPPSIHFIRFNYHYHLLHLLVCGRRGIGLPPPSSLSSSLHTLSSAPRGGGAHAVSGSHCFPKVEETKEHVSSPCSDATLDHCIDFFPIDFIEKKIGEGRVTFPFLSVPSTHPLSCS